MQKLGINLSDKVSAHINTAVVYFIGTEPVSSALAILKEKGNNNSISYIYVVDKDQKPIGVVPVRRLLFAAGHLTLEEIMVSPVIHISDDATVQDACDCFLSTRLLAIPVVNRLGVFTGVLEISLFTQEISELADQREVDQAFQLLGLHLSDKANKTILQSYKDRIPWLACNAVSGMIAAYITHIFAPHINNMVMIAMFTALVLALGESISMQSMSITLQQLARKARPSPMLRSLQELSTALLIAFSVGSAIGVTSFIWLQDIETSLVVSSTLFISGLASAIIGASVPAAIHRAKIDPKVASGPIVLAITDIFTLLTYFILARWAWGI